jgi:hypothetical protein
MRGEWRLRLVILKGNKPDLYGTAFLVARVQSVFEMAIYMYLCELVDGEMHGNAGTLLYHRSKESDITRLL